MANGMSLCNVVMRGSGIFGNPTEIFCINSSPVVASCYVALLMCDKEVIEV